MVKVSIPDDAPPVLASSLAYADLAARAQVSYHDTLPGSEETLIERLQQAGVAINIRSSSKFTARVFERCPRLRLLSLWGTGTDNVDLPAAAAAGVTVTNTPGVSAPSIAEHSLALLLAVARHSPRIDAETRQGIWPRGQVSQMSGKTLGVIGLGAIGRRMAKLGEGIGMDVIAWTMHPNPALGFALVPLEELFRASDVVSVHLRLSPDTKGLIGAREFAMMKRGAILINTARGPIVDEAAMLEALASGHLSGAGLDVFDVEPLPAGHPLTQMPNVVLTPHSAGVTPEALAAGLRMAVDNVWNFLAGRPTHVV
ncbi:MAG: phosphoglycerate dehydrogenase [Bryobacteraceae bacterium]